MLLNLHKVGWGQALKTPDFTEQHSRNVDTLKEMARLTADYNKWIQEETKKTRDEFVVSSVGKMNPKNHLAMKIEDNLNDNVTDCLGTMLNTVVF